MSFIEKYAILKIYKNIFKIIPSLETKFKNKNQLLNVSND